MNISHSPPTVQLLVIPAYPYTRVLYLPVFYVHFMLLTYEPADSIDSTFQELLQSISCGQMDSVLKEDVKIFADYKLMILCVNF